MSQTWTNVTCPGCGCVCDDIELSFNGPSLNRFDPSCRLGESWFRTHFQPAAMQAAIQGQPADVSSALMRAAELLGQANYPLIYGLSRSATPGQRAAVALGEQLGGVVDTTASLCHGPSIMALQEVGEVTSTLGEIKNRADLVIFWGCNPASSHPRHAERYSVFANGRHVPNGRNDRTVAMVGDANFVDDWRLTPDGDRPDHVIPIAPGRDYEAVAMLRALLAGHEIPDVPDRLRHLLQLMKSCRYGVVFFGLGIAESSMWAGPEFSATGHVNVAALLQLVADLNDVTRFTARRMRLQGDVSGADNVMCWQTGYPFGVDFSRGYPRYCPGEYTAADLLERHDVDACLLVGTETIQYFSEAAREHLRSIPTVVLEYPGVGLPFVPDVSVTTAVYGIHAAGTVFRMDNVPFTLRPMQDTSLPTDETVLQQLSALID